MEAKLKPNETLTDGAELSDITRAITEPGVTMVRLVVPDPTYVLGYKIICSMRLEGDGLYNMREARKVIKRHLTLQQAILAIDSMIDESIRFSYSLIRVVKPVMTKRKLTVKDILKAVGRE